MRKNCSRSMKNGSSRQPANTCTPSALPSTVLILPATAAATFATWLPIAPGTGGDRKSTRLNSSHSQISYAVFCLKKKKQNTKRQPAREAADPPAGAAGDRSAHFQPDRPLVGARPLRAGAVRHHCGRVLSAERKSL